MRDRANPADALDDIECVQHTQPLDALLQPAMGIEKTRIQIQDGLPDRAEPEMAGLDDARVNRAHRHFEHALAVDTEVRKLLGWLDRRTLASVECFSQRI